MIIRSLAPSWDPKNVTGGSAGGHPSLTLETQGGPGPADAKDPIDRASSAVQRSPVSIHPPIF